MNIISDVNYNSQTFQIFWEGGYKKFESIRELGSLENKKQSNSYYFIEDQIKALDNIIYTPTDFTIPGFIYNSDKFTKVYTGSEENNITASEIILKISSIKECLWIHRFSKHSTVRYFEKILSQIGCDTIKVGYYLICLKSNDQSLINKYKEYKIKWVSDLSEKKLNQIDEDSYDKNIENDQIFVYEFVKDNCPDFKILDSFLYCSVSYLDEKWELVINQILKMIKSNNRLLRKKVFEFIKKNFPNLKILNKKLWPHLDIKENKYISVDELSSTYPTLLAEIFMWMTLRNENSAILGSNIYDIREQSIDARAHLEQASKLNTPVVIQSSLNAIGQKEENNWGYLKVEDSTNSLSKAIINESRNMVNFGNKPPLFGIGLDHINVNGDMPKGRAIRFAKKAMESELVTYYVLDAESLFKPKNREPEEVKRLFRVMSEYVSDLLHNNQRAYIYDKEVCISELNYLGGKKAWIPSPEEVVSFAKVYRKVIREKKQAACNTRPVLFIGNVGTTHHSNDSGEINSEISKEWVESSKKYNFISAVLHGTTNTNREIVKSANVGCKKINVAGDFLQIFTKALPKRLKEVLDKSDEDVKKLFYLVRNDLNKLTNDEISLIKKDIADYSGSLMSDINSPKLSERDKEYFRYSFYKFSEDEIESIIEELKQQKNKQLINTTTDLIIPEIGRQMSPSMLEVTYGDKYKELVEFLITENERKYFHIDVGDGKFISRQFSGLEKIQFIKKNYQKIKIHVHLMVQSPHLAQQNGLSCIQEYAKKGSDKIAIHRRAFDSLKEMEKAIDQIRECNVEPGFIIETNDNIDDKLLDEIIKYNVNWVVFMGVTIGFGGQIFDINILPKISSLFHWSKKNNRKILIEADGGLNYENIRLCKDVGVQIFAGWSLIKDDDKKNISKKLNKINNLLLN